LHDLIEGYRRFRAAEWPRERERFETTARDGQNPRAMIIACSDSRVDPQMIFGAHPGELFVVRNIANIVPPYEKDAAHHGTSAALEFGVRGLQVGHLVVLGHGMCGGIRALLEGSPITGSDFLGSWIEIAASVRDRTAEIVPIEARRTACEQENVRLSLANLLTFPWVAEGVRSGKLSLHGAYFDIRQGVLFVLRTDGIFAEAV
jgi:carbonic anhydrase